MKDWEESMIRYEIVYENKNYFVQIVKIEEVPACTYGIINKKTGVMERPEMILSVAREICDALSEQEDKQQDKMTSKVRDLFDLSTTTEPQH